MIINIIHHEFVKGGDGKANYNGQNGKSNGRCGSGIIFTSSGNSSSSLQISFQQLAALSEHLRSQIHKNRRRLKWNCKSS